MTRNIKILEKVLQITNTTVSAVSDIQATHASTTEVVVDGVSDLQRDMSDVQKIAATNRVWVSDLMPSVSGLQVIITSLQADLSDLRVHISDL